MQVKAIIPIGVEGPWNGNLHLIREEIMKHRPPGPGWKLLSYTLTDEEFYDGVWWWG